MQHVEENRIFLLFFFGIFFNLDSFEYLISITIHTYRFIKYLFYELKRKTFVCKSEHGLHKYINEYKIYRPNNCEVVTFDHSSFNHINYMPRKYVDNLTPDMWRKSFSLLSMQLIHRR